MMRSTCTPFRFRPLAIAAIWMIGLVALVSCSNNASEQSDQTSGESQIAVWTGSDEALEVSIRLSPTEIRVGDPVKLVLAAAAPRVAEIDLPKLDESLGEFDIRSVDRSPAVEVEDGRTRITLTATLDTFASGVVELPPLTVAAALPNNASDPWTVETEPLAVTVASTLADDADPRQFREIRPIVPFELAENRDWIWLAIGVVGFQLLVAAVMAIWWWRTRSRGARIRPPLPPHIWAMQAMDRLAERDLPGRGEYHAYTVELSDIVRIYIERRFGLMAPERTTEEFLRELGGTGALGAGHRTLLEQFLRAADMVKFARHQPSNDDCHSMMSAAHGFVADTAPAPTTNGGSSNGSPLASTARQTVAVGGRA